MDKVKIYEIAKKLNLTSKEVVDIAKNLKLDVKNHLSSVDDETARKIEESVKSNSKKQDVVEQNSSNNKNEKSDKKRAEDTKNKKDSKDLKNSKDKGETPVIIRREVINSDVEKRQEQFNKKEEKKEQVGFVERRKNTDFNIVYRNKQTKPMTVSELFGLNKNKKEEKNPETEENKSIESKETKVAEENKINIEESSIKEEQINSMKKDNTNQEINNNDIRVLKSEETDSVKSNQENNQNGFRPNRDSQGGFRNRDMQDQNGYRQNREDRDQSGFRNRDNQNSFRNRDNQGGFRSRDNQNGFRQNRDNQGGFRNRDMQDQGGFRNRDNQNGFRNRDNQGGYRDNRNDQNGNNRFGRDNKNFGNNQKFGTKRPLDEKGIEKNIKNIMSVDTGEKEIVREYNKSIDKQKENNKFDENRTTKKNQKSRKNGNNEINEHKLKGLKRTNSLSNMFDDQDGGMLDYYDLTTQRGKKGKKKQEKEEERTKQKIFKLTEITIPETITVKDLAQELKKTVAEIIKKLLGYGIMATLNNEIDFDTAALISEEFGVTAIKKETVTEEDILFDESEDSEDKLQTRPPVVVVMGHVDHGKTSLLDTIRKTNVIEGEAGGITQAIGAYKVKINDREITFLDTPGHEAFTAMRARGAQITDIAILVVAANDGVMPQTVEAINHAKSAGIPIIVAVNKIDLPDANVDKVKQELMAYDLVSEEWGGDTIFVPISAKKHINIEQLLEMVLLVADMQELKANPNKQAKGVVIEARLDKAKGAIATMLVQRGTLDVGDTIVVGSSIGRIRSMIDDKGKKVKKAGPSTPVEIMGLTEVPEAGDTFYEVDDEKMAKHLIERRKRQAREKAINATSRVTLNDLFNQISKGNLKILNLIVKADVQGSVEAVKQSLEKLSNDEVAVKVIHSAAGAVNESDVTLAKVSNAIIIAFNVRPVASARDMADKDEVEIKQYSIIYQAIEDVESAMKGMLAPKFEEKVIGMAEVRQTFKVSNVGTIAGAYVTNGKLERNAGVRVLRDDVVIHEGKLASLKRFKDDVKEVAKSYECGIQIEGYNDIKEGDVIEAYVMEEVKK